MAVATHKLSTIFHTLLVKMLRMGLSARREGRQHTDTLYMNCYLQTAWYHLNMNNSLSLETTERALQEYLEQWVLLCEQDKQ